MSKLGFWVFSPLSDKGVNTRTDNLRVHTAGSDTRTMSVGTTARSGWLEWRSHGCPKVMGTTSINWKGRIYMGAHLFSFCSWNPKRCFYWGVPDVPKESMISQSIWATSKRKKKKLWVHPWTNLTWITLRLCPPQICDHIFISHQLIIGEIKCWK